MRKEQLGITPLTVVQKEKINSKQLLRRRLDGLIITEVEDNQAELYRGWSATTFKTKSGTLWRFHKRPDLTFQGKTSNSLSTKSEHEDIVQELRKRAEGTSKSFKKAESISHWDTIHFFTQNWDRLSSLFYKGQVVDTFKSISFADVDLGDPGVIDFIGLGPDGRIFVLDARNSRKRERLQDAVQRLSVLFPSIGQGDLVALRIAHIIESSTESLTNTQIRLNVYSHPMDKGFAATS